MASSTLVLGIVVHLLFLCTYVSASTGFTTDLIPFDSPLSPFYNPSSTHYDRLHNAIQRSLNRVEHFNRKMEAPLTPAIGEYLMKVSLGTPPVELLAIADTGSDLTWTQCLPCTECFNQTLPLFDPHLSSSYKTVSCGSDSCNTVLPNGCSQESTTCEYEIRYVDSSYTKGDLSMETFTIGSTNNSSLPNIVFGCGHSNVGIYEAPTNGLVGLGGGKLSLVSQLGVNGKKFSYCLTPNANSTSKISFGSDAVVSGSGVVTTPIVTKSGLETFYYLTLEALSVGDKRIAFANKDGTRDDNNVVEGNILIDSGSSMTYLPPSVFSDLVSALEEAISLPKVDLPDGQSHLCYTIDGNNKGDDDIELPISVTAHFKGADLVLQPFNIFSLVTDHMICLTILPDDSATFGNLAQMNILVGYDHDAHAVSFKPTDCTQLQ